MRAENKEGKMHISGSNTSDYICMFGKKSDAACSEKELGTLQCGILTHETLGSVPKRSWQSDCPMLAFLLNKYCPKMLWFQWARQWNWSVLAFPLANRWALSKYLLARHQSQIQIIWDSSKPPVIATDAIYHANILEYTILKCFYDVFFNGIVQQPCACLPDSETFAIVCGS